MPYKTIAIDGACRRNGKPDCISAGACFILDQDGGLEQSYVESTPELNSTSQRGELMGLQLAIDHVRNNPIDTVIITDSEYLFKTMTRGWLDRWKHENWKTAEGSDVKNRDLWEQIDAAYTEETQKLITFYHIKGHLLSIGAKKYHELMHQDMSGYTLYKKALEGKMIRVDKLEHARELSMTNNGFAPDINLLQRFAAMNLVADAVANLCLEVLEAEQWKAMLSSGSPA